MKEIDNSGSEIFPLREPIAGVKQHGKPGASALLAKALLSVAAAGLVTAAVLSGPPADGGPAVYDGPPVIEVPAEPDSPKLPPEDPEVKPPVKKPEISPPPTTPPPTTPPPTTPPPTTPPPTTPPPTTPPPYIPPYDPPTDPPTDPPVTEPPTEPPISDFTAPTLVLVEGYAAPDGDTVYVRVKYNLDLGNAADATIDITAYVPSVGTNRTTTIERYTYTNLSNQSDEIEVTAPLGTMVEDASGSTVTFKVSYVRDGSPQSFTLGPYLLPY